LEKFKIYDSLGFRISWRETKWFVLNMKQVTYKIEAFDYLFYFDKDGFKAGLFGKHWQPLSGPKLEITVIERKVGKSQVPKTKSETVAEAEKFTKYVDFEDSKLNANFTYEATQIIESGIACKNLHVSMQLRFFVYASERANDTLRKRIPKNHGCSCRLFENAEALWEGFLRFWWAFVGLYIG